MPPPLHFYPDRSVANFHYMLAAASGIAVLALLYPLATTPMFPGAWDWAWDVAAIAGIVAAIVHGWFAMRRARLILTARERMEPQLVIDHFGVLIRGDFLWRPHRFAWSKIASIDAVPHPDGVAISVTGDLGRLGRLVDLTIDSPEPAEIITLRLQQFAHRPTLH